MAVDTIPGNKRLPKHFSPDQLDGLVIATYYGDVTPRQLDETLNALREKEPDAEQYVQEALEAENLAYYAEMT